MHWAHLKDFFLNRKRHEHISLSFYSYYFISFVWLLNPCDCMATDFSKISSHTVIWIRHHHLSQLWQWSFLVLQIETLWSRWQMEFVVSLKKLKNKLPYYSLYFSLIVLFTFPSCLPLLFCAQVLYLIILIQ